MKKNIILLISLVILPILTFSQNIIPKLAWYNIYDGPGNSVDLTNDIKIDVLNNIYLAGRSVGLDGTDLLILKYSELGDSLLGLKFDSAPQSWDEVFSIAIDSKFNIYVIGSSTFEQNTFYAIFHKYSSAGKLLWAKNFNQNININSEGKQVVLNSKEEPIIGYNRPSAKIGKYSSSGDSLWTISFEDDTSSYQINYITTDGSDNIYAAILQLYDDGGDLPTTKVVILKINDSGEILWGKKFDSNGGKKIIFDNDGNPILLAADTKIIKFNKDGDTLWTKEYPHLGDIVITTDLIVNLNNEILFTGYGVGDNSWDYFTQKLSSDGAEVWTRIFDSDEQLNDYAFSLALDKGNNIYVTGGTNNSVSVGYCYTVKYSSDGEFKWKFKFDAPHSKFEIGKKIFVDDSNNVYIGGDVADSINGWNFLAFKIKQDFSTDIINIRDNILNSFSLSQNYPNPFNPTTTINYQIPKAGNVIIKVIDCLGREVKELVNEYKIKGRYTIEFSASSLASGVYFYQIRTSDYISVKKMILLK